MHAVLVLDSGEQKFQHSSIAILEETRAAAAAVVLTAAGLEANVIKDGHWRKLQRSERHCLSHFGKCLSGKVTFQEMSVNW